jgi:alpha-1,6-mannosyltransferase
LSGRSDSEAQGTFWIALAGAPWLTNAALLLFGLLIIQFCRTGVLEYQHYTYGFSADVFAQLALYLGALAMVERCPTDKWTLPIIFTIALLARLVCIFHPAFLSTDVYRYVWDGRVQGAGINPFRYIPADRHLNFLRDTSIYPNINRRDYAHTIYPPGAQAIFFAVTRLGASEPLMKLAMTGFEAVTCLVLMKILTLVNLPRERVLLYAWNPLCLWEIASSGHVDAAALTFISLALYASIRDHRTQASAWLGLATLVKMYPIVLLPAMLSLPLHKRSRRRLAIAVATTLGVIGLGYSCYATVGAGVFGFLPAYAQEEGLASGSRYFPLTFMDRLLHRNIPPAVYLAICAVGMLALCLWALRRGATRNASIFSALVIATVLNLCYAPHYPWYFLWLLPSLTIYPWRPAFYLVTAATFLFATQLGAPGEPMYLLNKLLYGGFLFVLAYDLLNSYLVPRIRAFGQSIYQPRAPVLAEQLADAREL